MPSELYGGGIIISYNGHRLVLTQRIYDYKTKKEAEEHKIYMTNVSNPWSVYKEYEMTPESNDGYAYCIEYSR